MRKILHHPKMLQQRLDHFETSSNTIQDACCDMLLQDGQTRQTHCAQQFRKMLRVFARAFEMYLIKTSSVAYIHGKT